MSVDIRRILEILPHRYPFLFVDRIEEMEPGRRIVGIKNVTINEPFFQGHFPGNPVMPGVLILEAMGQVATVLFLAEEEMRAGHFAYFAAADKIRFRRPVVPGDQLRCEVEVLRVRRKSCKVQARATVEGELVAEARLFSVLVEVPELDDE
ncbi:MAG: 3-hydroxyacyl-ACP dehydratase FabZ [Acidobacteria bacterium]|nr:3-hydroxyacyl-ACP dehydratase FabZ [Acidobacteriota bacterium]